MSQILLVLIVLSQGILVQRGGTVTGVLRDLQGMPVAGVRMAAIARSDALTDASPGTVMAGLTLTDEEGRFTLENIPPGRYVIAAGRLDLQTFYPGTLSSAEATVVTIAPGSVIREINFALIIQSVGRADSFGGGWARLAAYQDIVWPDGKQDSPRVLLSGTWYELLSVENVPVKDLIEYARRTFADQWQKRFEEDMVEILAGLGRPSKDTVSLGLRNPESSMTLILSSPMNRDNRSALMNAKRTRWTRDTVTPP